MKKYDKKILDILSNKTYRVVKFLYSKGSWQTDEGKRTETIFHQNRDIKFVSPMLTFNEAKLFLENLIQNHTVNDKGYFFYVAHYRNPFVSADGCGAHILKS